MLFEKKIMTVMLGVFILLGLLACSNNGADAVLENDATVTDTTVTETAAAIISSGLTLALTDNAAETITTISSGSPAIVTVTATDTDGATVSGVVITFTVDTDGLAVLNPPSGTAITNASGVATLSLASVSLTAAGAATLTATSQIGTEEVSQSIGFAVGAASVTISSPIFGVGTAALSAYGSTSVSVNVFVDGVLAATPQTVSFTSVCAANGKANLTANVVTVNGVASASYLDNGCAGNDTVTVSVSGIAIASETLSVSAPSAGSIQFESVAPSSGLIKLKGVGGQESAQVTFKLVDTNGNPMGGKEVTFSLNTNVGGITINSASAISDPLTGYVVVSVQSGIIATPVRVSAATVAGSKTLTSQSSQLVISTGIPDQQNFSLSATKLNIEGWDYDGETTTLTARVADHFNNPVLDGTAVYFTAEGSSVEPACFTINGACSVVFTSQTLRPDNGRVTVLAYAIGEEGFTDSVVNNGLADGLPEMLDANDRSTDMPEAFLDKNESGTLDANEVYRDFNGDGTYNAADGLYNGILCDQNVAPGSTSTACNTRKNIHVRDSLVIVLSSSHAAIAILDSTGNTLDPIDLPVCTSSGKGAPLDFIVRVLDVNGNAMPVGTEINFSANNGTILSSTDDMVGNETTCKTGGGCPVSAASATFGNYFVKMESDAKFTESTSLCSNERVTGVFTVKVTTPKGNITDLQVTLND
jgi:hypothetical protein